MNKGEEKIKFWNILNERSNHVIIIRLSEDIPANAFVRLTFGYSSWYEGVVFYPYKPNADNMNASKIVINIEEVKLGWLRGVAIVEGIGVVKAASGETIAVGDKVGTKNNDWFAKKIADEPDGTNRGQFLVLGKQTIGSDDFLLVRARVRDFSEMPER